MEKKLNFIGDHSNTSTFPFLQFLELGNALRASKDPPTNTTKELDPILAALSEDKDKRLKEVTSVVIIAKAASSFPKDILQQILDLPKDKKESLKEVVSSTSS